VGEGAAFHLALPAALTEAEATLPG
jgi:hypothetical protein